MTPAYGALLQRRFSWDRWEHLIYTDGIHLDRPAETRHPRYPDIIYPMDYGFVRGTMSSDGAEVDAFVGSHATGLVGLLACKDHRQGKREIKLLWHCSPREVYLANGFINFAPHLLTGMLVLRYPMAQIRAESNLQ